MGYIYILTSPSGKSYIGQTIRSIKRRFKEHQTDSSKCVAIYNAIQYHGWENFEKDYYECPDEDLNFDEELLVREMGTLAPGGYNLKEGGDNGKLSDETKQKIGDAHRGKYVSEETRTKLSKSNMGEFRTVETKKKQREAQLGEKSHMFGKTGEKSHLFGKPRSKETKRKIGDASRGEKHVSSKKVYQYDLEGKLLGTFGSTGEAGRYVKGCGVNIGANIGACARSKNRNKTAYGFKWSYTIVKE